MGIHISVKGNLCIEMDPDLTKLTQYTDITGDMGTFMPEAGVSY